MLQVTLELPFYPNPLLFDTFGVHPGATLHASGFCSLMLYSVPSGRASTDRSTVAISGHV